MIPFGPRLPSPLLLLLCSALLQSPSSNQHVHALSSHSPQDLLAYPKYAIVLSATPVTNSTAEALLQRSAGIVSEDKSDVGSEESDDLRRVPRNHLILNSQGQPFLCHVPYPVNPAPSPAKVTLVVTEEQRKEERLKGLERGLTLLEPLKERGCLYQSQGWFTYAFCHGSEIRQFHAIEVAGSPYPNEDPHTEAYTLGLAPSAPPPSAPSDASVYENGLTALSEARVEGLGAGANGDEAVEKRYLIQKWTGGTICDMTGRPRQVEVQFHCNSQSTDRIALIRETAICEYVMVIHTPRLCGETIFMGSDAIAAASATSLIQCQPVVSDGYDFKTVDASAADDGMGAGGEKIRADTEAGKETRFGGEPQKGATNPESREDEADPETFVLLFDPQTGEVTVDEGFDAALTSSQQEQQERGQKPNKQQQGQKIDIEIKPQVINSLDDIAALVQEQIEKALKDAAANNRQAGAGGAGRAGGRGGQQIQFFSPKKHPNSRTQGSDSTGTFADLSAKFREKAKEILGGGRAVAGQAQAQGQGQGQAQAAAAHAPAQAREDIHVSSQQRSLKRLYGMKLEAEKKKDEKDGERKRDEL